MVRVIRRAGKLSGTTDRDGKEVALMGWLVKKASGKDKGDIDGERQ